MLRESDEIGSSRRTFTLTWNIFFAGASFFFVRALRISYSRYMLRELRKGVWSREILSELSKEATNVSLDSAAEALHDFVL